MPQPCVVCGSSESDWKHFLMGCCHCNRNWHHTCHSPPVPALEMHRMLSEYNSKKRRGLLQTHGRFDWTCGDCRQRMPSSSLVPRPAPIGTPIVIDDDDDDIQIVEKPASTTRGTVNSKATQPPMVIQRPQGSSTPGPSSRTKKLAPPKPAPEPEIITLSDDDDLEPILAPVATTFKCHPPKQHLTAQKGQAPVPPEDQTRLELAPVLSPTGAIRAETVAQQKSLPKNVARPPIKPILKAEPSITSGSLGAVSDVTSSNQSHMLGPPRSVPLTASFLAGLSDLSVTNETATAVHASPNISKQPQLLYQWINAKMDQVVLARDSRPSSSIPKRPRKAITTRHIMSLGNEQPFDFTIESWKSEKLAGLRRG